MRSECFRGSPTGGCCNGWPLKSAGPSVDLSGRVQVSRSILWTVRSVKQGTLGFDHG